MIQSGYGPLGMVMGSCVYHIAHQGFMQTMGNVGQNVEIPQFTEALYDARELAMSRMQAEAEQLHAEGIVGVQLLSLPHRWGGHTTEFFAIGTAVRPLRPDHIIHKPQLVLAADGLTDEPSRPRCHRAVPSPTTLMRSRRHFGRIAADLDVYARVLTTSLAAALPEGIVEVERDRSMGDRLAGRPGIVRSLRVGVRRDDAGAGASSAGRCTPWRAPPGGPWRRHLQQASSGRRLGAGTRRPSRRAGKSSAAPGGAVETIGPIGVTALPRICG